MVNPSSVGAATSDRQPRVGIVLLNWNGWRDTIECLESLRLLVYPDFAIYVVDNDSSDGSEARLRAWDPALAVIQSGGNLGWAGGCNVGICRALADGCEHVYLLNNDAAVRPDTLSQLVAAARLPQAAAVGSLIVSANDPGLVEFAGTVLDERTRLPRQIFGRIGDIATQGDVSATLAVKGCSMLLTGAALRRIGLLDADYFLNFDETDWCFRALRAGMTNYHVPASVVAHKGAVSFRGTDTPLYLYFMTRNRLLFARRHLDARGRFFAWRSALWEARHALTRNADPGRSSPRHRLLRLASVLLAVRDFGLGKFGDCPKTVRLLTDRYLSR